MKESFESFQENIVNDIKQQLNSSNNKEDTYKEIISSIDTKIQPINALITANQTQMIASLSNLKESSIISQTNQNKVIEELGDFLNKYRTNSNFKGKSSENMLEVVLNKIFPTSEVINSSSSLKMSGDFMLKREGRLPILIENKNYDLAIQKEGVEKFLNIPLITEVINEINQKFDSDIVTFDFCDVICERGYDVKYVALPCLALPRRGMHCYDSARSAMFCRLLYVAVCNLLCFIYMYIYILL
jgi:hypothetical protein